VQEAGGRTFDSYYGRSPIGQSAAELMLDPCEAGLQIVLLVIRNGPSGFFQQIACAISGCQRSDNDGVG
jgi:hypothetical protein